FDKLLNDKNVRKILLVRENSLRSFVSQQLALQTGVWDRFSDDQTVVVPKLTIDIDKFKNYMRNVRLYLDHIRLVLEKLNQSFLVLTYEEISADFPTKRISTFLETELINISFNVEQKRQNPFRIQEIATNYNQIKSELDRLNLQII
ncbi:unnamed protein product, partial [Ectocarpus fasciculatus]